MLFRTIVKPDAAERPAPATAIIRLDDDKTDLNAIMSSEGVLEVDISYISFKQWV